MLVTLLTLIPLVHAGPSCPEGTERLDVEEFACCPPGTDYPEDKEGCYTSALDDDPALAGKVVVKFVIAKDGTVSSAATKSSTMNNPAVEQCINAEVMRLRFAEPKGGGIVIVSYPLMFSPG